MVRFMMSERFNRRAEMDTAATEPPKKRVCLSQETSDSTVKSWDQEFTNVMQKTP